MGKWYRKLRIGEKIGFGFGIVGLLFLGVIWGYHSTLQQALTDYRQLHDIHGARKTEAVLIEGSMLRAQRAEKNFVLSRDEAYASEVHANLEQALASAARMRAIEQDPDWERMQELIDVYGQRFQDVVDAWRLKGLDHNSGLQGAFRDSVHELEDMAEKFKVDRLYLVLLQIRRGEKDLGLRREELYRDRVLQLVQDFSAGVAESGLDEDLKARLVHEISIYRDTFGQYARTVLGDPQPHAGKGPFRQAAHRIEDLLRAHYLSGLGEDILQLRRREKDYLLRDDKRYVDMAIEELDRMRAQVNKSEIAEGDEKHFLFLLDNYRRDFLALVSQNDRISRLSGEMLAAVTEIVGLVEGKVADAERAMMATRLNTDSVSTRNEHAMLWVVVIATLLGLFLAYAITVSIVRPLLRMAGLLDRLAAEQPAERMPFFAGGRDEVNLMAGSVNAMADHKAGFIDWWKATMREADACERLHGLMRDSADSAQLAEAQTELRDSRWAKEELLQEQHRSIHQLVGRIIDKAETLLEDARSGSQEVGLNTIRYSARAVQTRLEMVSGK